MSSKNKAKYMELCGECNAIRLFSQAWWLDVVCGEANWDVALEEKSGRVLGALPYYVKSECGSSSIVQPLLTQTLGPWIAPSTAKYAKQLAQQKDIMQGLMGQLPKHDYFGQNFHYSITNWLPFFWKGYSQNTRYTYVIEELENLDDVWSGFKDNIKSDVRKAEKQLEVVNNLSVEEFYRVAELTFKRQGKRMPYTLAFFEKLYLACREKGAGKMFFAVDSAGRTHAVAFVVWDQCSAYYLVGGADPELRNSGASSLCLWDAIRFSSTVTKTFDFEGSMIESVERFFRGFGAVQKTYFKVEKYNAWLPYIKHILRDLRQFLRNR